MNNRRKFFGQIGLILGAAAAPMMIVPRSNIYWGKPKLFTPHRYLLKAVWNPELAQDLQGYHGINVEAELHAMVRKETDVEFPNKKLIRIEKGPYYVNPYTLTPRCSLYATVV
jgi:hypothetical protein